MAHMDEQKLHDLQRYGTWERMTGGQRIKKHSSTLTANRLAHAADEMREAMAYQAGVSPDEINIVVDVVLPSNISELKVRAEEQL